MSGGELVAGLMRLGHDEPLARRAVQEARQCGWIDERGYAESICRRVLSRGPAARALLEQRLVERALGAELIREVVDAVLECVDVVEAATELARRDIVGRRRRPTAATARRIATVLARRGFGDDTVSEVLYRLGLSDVSDE